MKSMIGLFFFSFAALCLMGCTTFQGSLQKLKSDHAEDRAEAIHWLYHHVKTQTTKNLLVQSLTRDNNEVVRSLAARLMGLEKDPQFIPFLNLALKDKSYLVRMESLQSLGNMNATSSLGEMVSLLGKNKETKQEQEPNPWVRLKVVKVLDHMEARSEIPSLIKGLDDRDPAVRFHVLLLLEKFSGQKVGIDQESWEKWYKEEQKKKTKVG